MELPFTSRDLSYLDARLVAATATAYTAATVADVHELVLPLMDPDFGLVQRLTALLDTASQRLTALEDEDPPPPTTAPRLWPRHCTTPAARSPPSGTASPKPTSRPTTRHPVDQRAPPPP
jgi:hypothetical protein